MTTYRKNYYCSICHKNHYINTKIGRKHHVLNVIPAKKREIKKKNKQKFVKTLNIIRKMYDEHTEKELVTRLYYILSKDFFKSFNLLLKFTATNEQMNEQMKNPALIFGMLKILVSRIKNNEKKFTIELYGFYKGQQLIKKILQLGDIMGSIDPDCRPRKINLKKAGKSVWM